MTAAATSTFAGAPCDDPAWRSITLGSYVFPPSPGFDSAIAVDVDEGLKVDQQKASGKDKAKTKVNGVDVTKAKVTIEWTYRIWAATRAFLIGISPNGPSKGDPLDASHPELNDRGVTKVLVTKVGKLERNGPRAWKQTIELEEWVDPGTAATGGGTKTPDKAQNAADNWADMPLNGGSPATPAPKGFGGPNKPSGGYQDQTGGH